MALQISLRKNVISTFEKHLQCYASTSANKTKLKQQKDIISTGQVANMGKSLASKGFLRPTKPYSPSVDVNQKVQAICAALQIPVESNHKLANLEEKFKFLEACYKDFQHTVPNSQVHELNTIADVIEYYKTAVDTTVPYDALKKIDLPENLHIQYDYVRFHPDTDTKFNGQTAFPKSSTLVTGLKYRGKYEGHEAKRSWP